MKVRRYKCKCADCDKDCQERITFAPDSHCYTRRFTRYVVDLLKGNAPSKTQPIFWACRGTRSKRFTLLSVAALSWESGQHRHRRVCRPKRACVQDHCRWPPERSDSPCGSGQGGRCFGRIPEKGAEGRSSTSSISPLISRQLLSPLYLKTARTPCMSSIIFMWSNWWMKSWTRYAGRNITLWKKTSTSAKSFLFCGRELSFILIFKFRNRLSRLFFEKAH